MTTERQRFAEKGLYPAGVVAERIGKSTQAVYYWITTGKIEGVKSGDHWYVSFASVKKHLGEEACAMLGLGESPEPVAAP